MWYPASGKKKRGAIPEGRRFRPPRDIYSVMNTETAIASEHLQRRSGRLLHLLGCPVHRIGFRQLCVAIPLFAKGEVSSVCKELYPLIARTMGCSDWRAVERSIRCEILDGWKNGDPKMWDRFFPGRSKAPSNKEFICTMAELLTSRLELDPEIVPLHQIHRESFYFKPPRI